MKTIINLKKSLLMLGIAISIILPGNSYADDTEVFLGVTTNTIGVQPNVLFLLDTSGSMGGQIGGGDSTVRMVAMKQAMAQIIGTANNLNIGLMTFNGNNGGPVRLPVRDIDAPLNVDEGFQVVRNIIQGSDDAQQIDDSSIPVPPDNGAMVLSAQSIYLSQGPSTSAGTTTIKIPMAVNTDEIDEVRSNGFQYDTDRDFLISPSFITGLRFQNVNLPNGADVVDASIRLTAYRDSPPTNNLTITGEDVDDSASMVGTGMVNMRYLASPTTSTQPWNFSGYARDQQINTPNIEHVIDEIIARPNWGTGLSGKVLSFFITSTNGSFRGYGPHNSNSASEEPELEITYISSAGGAAGKRTTGLRFQDVRIPQGATITEAYISVKSSTTSNTAVDLQVQAENVVDANTFTTANNNITNRTPTSAIQNWNLATTDNWVANERYFSPDIANVVQEVVNQGAWCGGNALSLLIRDNTAVDAREFYTFDGAIDTINDVPTLHVKYDLTGISASETGCTLRTITQRIDASTDDVEEESNGNVQTTSEDMDLGGLDVGLRFNNIFLPQGADILSANIEFTARTSRTDPAAGRIYGESIDNSPTYVSGANDQVTDRINNRATSASVTWNNIVNSTLNQTYLTPDIGNIVQEIVNRSGWQSGNAMSFMIEAITNRREYYSYNGDASRAPRLIIDAQVNLTASSIEGETVRDQLLSEINSLTPNGGTPITDVLYEGIQYYRGAAVDWGTTRGLQDGNGNGKTYARVSHPDSYENESSLYRASGCTDSNLNSSSCRSEEIRGSANYISPLDNACQANYIVVLTDGSQNTFYGQNRIRSLTGTTCSGDTSDTDGNCGYALATYAQTNDLSTNQTGSNNLPGNQNATIYTIGFTANSNPTYMQGLATRGGGRYFPANSASQLVDVFQQITQDILSQPATFTAPALTINAFNQLFNTRDVYVSLFEPSLNSRWAGNFKKYQLCTASDGVAFICDANDNAITNPLTNEIKDSAVSLWDTIDDGAEIKVGGAGAQIQQPDNRRVFTYTGSAAPDNTDLGLNIHALSKVNSDLTPTLLGVGSNADKADLIDWIRGVDTEGENDGPHGDSVNSRWAYADALHSAAATITYGGTSSSQIDKLLVGTNDGFVRMINTYNGQEEWAFMPQQLLQQQTQLRTNAQADHLYGVDGAPTIWRYDRDNDGIIEPSAGVNSDFVHAYIGMRRGGNSYFGLDITPTSTIADPAPTGSITPKLMWRIDGGAGDFARLGQTWSTPALAKIAITEGGNVKQKDVLIFGGGYDVSYDTTMATSNIGNAIYIVDAETGDRLWWASNTGSGASIRVPGMDYSIPSDVTLADVNADGLVDRLYVGDLGGNVWRIDLLETLSAASTGGAIAHKLASLGHAASVGDTTAARRFMYKPQVALLNNDANAGGASYIAVAINSGNRANPTDNTIHDRVFMLRDTLIFTMQDTNSDGVADGLSTLVEADLYDAYADVYETTNEAALISADGWYFDLRDGANYIGEKGISEGLIFASSNEEIPYIYLFSTYLPPGSNTTATACGATTGFSRTFLVNLLNATQAYNDSPSDNNSTTGGDDKGRYCADPSDCIDKATPPPPNPVLVNPEPAPGAGVCANGITTALTGLGDSRGLSDQQCFAPTYWIKK